MSDDIQDCRGTSIRLGDLAVHASRYSSTVRMRRCRVLESVWDGPSLKGLRVQWLDDGAAKLGLVAPYNLLVVKGFL